MAICILGILVSRGLDWLGFDSMFSHKQEIQLLFFFTGMGFSFGLTQIICWLRWWLIIGKFQPTERIPGSESEVCLVVIFVFLLITLVLSLRMANFFYPLIRETIPAFFS
jgi:hypothetical protein